jgi:4-alpha-glucanotransferase
MHVTSLPSKYGIGDMGPAALAWIDQLRQAGQGWWQALSLGPTDYGKSPYQPLSPFAGNEFFVHVLNLGTSARMNTPGQAGGNWRWRLTDGLLLPAAFDWLGDLTKQTNRSAVHSAAADRPRSEKPR